MGFGSINNCALLVCVVAAATNACCIADDSPAPDRLDARFRLSVSARSQLMNFARSAELRQEPVVRGDAPRWRLLLSDGTVLRRVPINTMPRLVRGLTGDLFGADVASTSITHPDRLLALPQPAVDDSVDRRGIASIVILETAAFDPVRCSTQAFEAACRGETPRPSPGLKPLRVDPSTSASEPTEVLASLKPDLSPLFVEAGPVEGGPSIKSRGAAKRR